MRQQKELRVWEKSELRQDELLRTIKSTKNCTYQTEDVMPNIKLTEDVRPLSEFRSNVAAVVNQVRDTKRAVILTQHGRSAAVLLDVGCYEKLLEEVQLLRDVRAAEIEIARGKGISHRKAKAQVLARIAR
jgi:antitoxin YefM